MPSTHRHPTFARIYPNISRGSEQGSAAQHRRALLAGLQGRAIRHGTLRKMRQNRGWAIGYNTVALPIAAGVFATPLGLVLRPELAALSMPGSSLIVAVNALLLKRLHLPRPAGESPPEPTAQLLPKAAAYPA